MLNSRQRAQLKGLANSMDTILQIGKSGVGEQLVKQVKDALEARELIKLKCLETSPVTSREAADQIAELVGADVVQVIGGKFVLYKQSSNKENRKIISLFMQYVTFHLGCKNTTYNSTYETFYHYLKLNKRL